MQKENPTEAALDGCLLQQNTDPMAGAESPGMTWEWSTQAKRMDSSALINANSSWLAEQEIPYPFTQQNRDPLRNRSF